MFYTTIVIKIELTGDPCFFNTYFCADKIVVRVK